MGRALTLLVAWLAVPLPAGARDACALAVADSPASTQDVLHLDRAATERGRVLDERLEAFASDRRAGPTRDGRQALRRRFDASVAPPLRELEALCACLRPYGLPSPACEALPRQKARACALLPRRLHGIELICLSRGR